MKFKENLVKIVAIIFSRPGLGRLYIERPTLITKKGAEILLQISFGVVYISLFCIIKLIKIY
jgi:hypothetical protein